MDLNGLGEAELSAGPEHPLDRVQHRRIEGGVIHVPRLAQQRPGPPRPGAIKPGPPAGLLQQGIDLAARLRDRVAARAMLHQQVPAAVKLPGHHVG